MFKVGDTVVGKIGLANNFLCGRTGKVIRILGDGAGIDVDFKGFNRGYEEKDRPISSWSAPIKYFDKIETQQEFDF